MVGKNKEMIDEATVGEQWDIERLIPYAKNAKKHPDNEVEQLAKAIETFKWTTRIIVDGKGEIINGHGRRLAALSLGLKTVPVTVRDDLSKEQVRALRLVDNRVAGKSYDNDFLEFELSELADLDVDIGDFFSKEEMNFAIGDIDIDIDSITDNLADEVAAQTGKTRERLEMEEAREVPLRDVFDFNKVSPTQGRVIKLLVAHAEGETGETGAEALMRYSRDWLGIE